MNDDDDRVTPDAPVAVVSHRYWRTRLSSDSAVVGKTIQIDSHAFTVIGVAAPDFFGVEVGVSPDVWVTLATQPQLYSPGRSLADDAEANWLAVIGRRASGVTHARAESGATLVLQQFQKESARPLPDDWPRNIRLIDMSRGLSRLRNQYEASLRLLMGVVAIVMLIACASITTLMMTRSTARRREIAVRLTLGATRARLVRQLLTEGAILSLCGGALGVALATWGLGAWLTCCRPGAFQLQSTRISTRDRSRSRSSFRYSRPCCFPRGQPFGRLVLTSRARSGQEATRSPRECSARMDGRFSSPCRSRCPSCS